MCARVDQGGLVPEALARVLDASWVAYQNAMGEGWRGRHNLPPTEPMLLLAASREGDRRLGVARFGWQVGWQPGPLLNAKVETLHEKPSFRQAWQQQRGAVPVAGYYEWSQDEAGQKQGWRFVSADGQPLLLAALWQKSEAGQTQAVILTTEANALASPIHHRMPVVLSTEGLAAWLKPGPPPLWGPGLGEPAAEGLVRRHLVDPLVGKVVSEGAWCSAPHTPPPPAPAQGKLPGF